MNQTSKTRTRSKTKTSPAPPLEEFQVGSSVYLTRLNTKFVNRQKWIRPDLMKLTAVIPGTIQRVLVKEGDEVAHGSPLLILEAMKMRNQIVSPVGGVVDRIHVTTGEKVPKNHLLIEFR